MRCFRKDEQPPARRLLQRSDLASALPTGCGALQLDALSHHFWYTPQVSRQLPVPFIRHSVGRAAYELRLAAASILSSESLREIARSLVGEGPALREFATEESAYRLGSTDGSWSLRLGPAVFSLETDCPGRDEVAALLHLIRDRMSDESASVEFERVALAYFSAVPIQHQRIEDLLIESVVELLQDRSEAFTQALSGTWHRGHYTLHYGVQPLEERTFYLSDAQVIAPSVPAQELDAVLGELDQEGLRLLSWPITEHAVEVFTTNYDQILAQAVQAFHPWFQPFSEEPDVEMENRKRFELLTKKHWGAGFSAEDEARLEAMTERVRLLLPRVTQEDWQLVNGITDRQNEVHDRTQRIRKKYGLSG